MESKQPEIIIQPSEPGMPASRWVVIGASVQGTSHMRVGLPCQDAYAFKVINDDILVAAVADGLGTAASSQVGSKLAAASVVTCLEQVLTSLIPGEETSWIKLIQECFISARDNLEEEAQRSQSDLRSYGTTLVLAVLAPGWLVTGQIGDGAVVAAQDDGRMVLASLPQNEEYVNVTYPLTMPDMLQHAEFKASHIRAKALALMTDGMQHVSIRSLDKAPHAPFFEPLFRQLSGVKDMQKASLNLAEFMASSAISSRTDDDKTLVLIGQQNGERDNASMHSQND